MVPKKKTGGEDQKYVEANLHFSEFEIDTFEKRINKKYINSFSLISLFTFYSNRIGLKK
jgi:hypothetical protein